MSEINIKEVRERLENLAKYAGHGGFAFGSDLSALLDDHAGLQASLQSARGRLDALQKIQHRMRDPERTMVCDILANGTDRETAGVGRYELVDEAVTVLRIPSQSGLDAITVYIDSPDQGAAAVTIRCYSSAWAACAWTAYWGSMGTDAVRFMASVNADYMEGCMLWPNACAVPKREREYARRVAQVVIDHCRALVAKVVPNA